MEKVLLLSLSIVFFYFNANFITAKTCWKYPACKCSGVSRISIYCSRVRDIGDVIDLLHSRSPVYKIRLRGNFTTIPSKAFDNVSVSILRLEAPLKFDIPDDCLLGIQNLKTLILNKTEYSTIPKAFSNQYYTEFASSNGRLVSIGTQLQNMSSATEIRLNKNQINTIFKDAFHGTNKIHRLDLSDNKLVYIDPETLEPLTFLKDIYLQNNYLQMLNGCFDKLNPTVIDLYGNNLTNIDNVLHSGMWNLKYLNLGRNPELELTNQTFHSSLKSLSSLHLSNNEYNSLDPNLLKRLFKLHELYLNNNNLVYFHKYFFENNHFLSVLQLSNNRLTTIEEPLKYRKHWFNWMKISLDGNQLKTIALGKNVEKIMKLDISRNQISQIEESDIVVLKNVTYLNLSHNELTSMERNTFRRFKRLETLDLSHNPLKHLNRSLQGLSKMYILYLSSMSLEHLTENDFLGMSKLKRLFLSNNSLQDVSGSFRQINNLGVLDLAMNNLTTLTIDSLPSLWNFSIRLSSLSMAGNPWLCDCRLAWMASSRVQKKHMKLLDEPVCAAPDHLKGRTLRSLNLTDYLKWYDDCPDVCECTCQWDGYKLSTEASCVRLGLEEIPKVFPTNLRILDMRWNNIQSFDNKEILGLANLEQLNLEHNSIHKIKINGLPPKMSSLQLAYNQLQTFPVETWMKVKVSVKQTTLSHNPWICDCNALSFRNWIIKKISIIKDVDDLRCGEEESFYLRNKLIMSLTENQLCSFISNVIILSICSAIFLIIAVLIFCYRHSLTALCYTSGCRCLKSAEGHEYPYDIFLMYSEDDEQFVLGELATGLENPKYSFNVCIPSRDIAAPRTQQKINSYLPLCTKVLVILTKSFTENRECIRFLISAMSFSTGDSAKCIIFILKGELQPNRDLDPTLKTLLRSCTCLRWGEWLFWQKLIYQLPKKEHRKQQSGDVEEEPHLMP